MADGFIVRRGGKATEQALAPTITEVSVTDSSITFTIKNNDTETATIVYRIDDLTAEGESISLAGGATSSNITESGLDDDTEFIVFATANVTGKVKSNVTQLAITTDPTPVYTAATGGTTEEYDDGGKRYKSHTFTSNGTFEVTTVGDATDDRNKVDYLIIAGGGGGGEGHGGGGAGGFRTTIAPVPSDESPDTKPTVSVASYGVTIGSGGTGASTTGNAGANGVNSQVAFSATIIATGGGGGGSFGSGQTPGSGGSGGGGSTGGTTGGSGTLGQGRNGGDRIDTNAGGGGAGAVGSDGVTGVAGNGGDGLANLLRTGSNETRAGGGGAGGRLTSGGAVTDTPGSGGSGGGGNGGTGASTRDGSNGAANTGGGGGGGGVQAGVASRAGYNGGDGIVIIRYEIAPTV
jgi:hypothetical protein